MSRQTTILLGVGILAAVGLALSITGAVREAVVVPLLYLWFVAGVLLTSIPQSLLWGGFLVVALVAALRSMAPPQRPRYATPPPATPASTTLYSWAGLLERAATDRYARFLLSQRMGELAMNLLATPEQTQGQPAWQFLESESLGMPADVRDFLRAGRRNFVPPARFAWLWQWLGRAPTTPDALDIDPERVVHFFERQLHTDAEEEERSTP